MDILHTWWLVRLLVALLLACPFLVVPVLLGLFKKQPDAKHPTAVPAERGTRVEVSGRGTWTALAGSRSQPLQPDAPRSPIERRAA